MEEGGGGGGGVLWFISRGELEKHMQRRGRVKGDGKCVSLI